jgi:primosomal protein N' (replication factor Y)
MPQQRLFDDDPGPWQLDDQAENLVATVVFAEGPEGDFDYLVPDRLADQVEPGRRVRVPLGKSNRPMTGYCTAVVMKPAGSRKLKAVLGVIDRRGLLSPAMLRLTQWIAEHYLCPWGHVLEGVVPAGVRDQAGTRKAVLLSVAPDVAARLGELKLSKVQQHAMRVLADLGRPAAMSELMRLAKCSAGPIAALRAKGCLRSTVERVEQAHEPEPKVARQSDLVLNPDQERALCTIRAALNSREHHTLLLHGVTGSGKTEVYLQAAQEVAGFGRQVIVLVPEISLTPQTLERFRSRFDRVAVLHSHLSDAERHRQWQRIADGQVQVVVGARSAIFAPTPHLGLVVIDEEHETSFKQDTAPRYHARDVAIVRARAEKVPLVLGSATPALETWHRAQTGEYQLIELPQRVLGRMLPRVGTIDLRDETMSKSTRGAISRPLHVAMNEALRDGGQVILLLNRRGFSTHIQCPACGEVVKCPDCEIALTHHRAKEIALCHYCDYEVPAPTKCPKCDLVGIQYSGQGTQRLEAEVKARFPEYSCFRMDTDSMQRPGSHERALTAFREGKVRILLGTQMIAKGLDFPNVTLVGVINADTALHFPDFRAAERTFHLVTQVAGRTGRGDRGGRVLVQTFNPDHVAIVSAVRHDYKGFATAELPMRKMLSYPPFASMVRLVVRGPVEEVTNQFAASIAEGLTAALASSSAQARVLGPAPAPFSKLRGKYRFQIQLHGPDGRQLREAVVAATRDLKPPEEVQWIVDVDPVDML